jgi:hypothetical protein
MKRFKTVVNTVIANFQETKSRKAFEEIKKTEIDYTEKVLERIGLFDKNANDIKVLIQRNIIKQKDLETFNINTELFKNNNEIKKLIKTIQLLEEILLRNTNLFLFNVTENIFNKLKDKLTLLSNKIINLSNLEILSNELISLIDNLKNKLSIKGNIKIIDFDKKYSDYINLIKCITILITINIRILNIIVILQNNNIEKNVILLSESTPSISLNEFDNEKIIDIITDYKQKDVNIKDAKKIFKIEKINYNDINNLIELINKNDKILNRIKRTINLLYNLILKNINIFEIVTFNIKKYKEFILSKNKELNYYNINFSKYIFNREDLTNSFNDSYINELNKTKLDVIFLPLITLLKNIEDKPITVFILKLLQEEILKLYATFNKNLVSKNLIILKYYLNEDLDPEIETDVSFYLKIHHFKKGYKDYKNYLRYLSIINTLNNILENVFNIYKIKLNTTNIKSIITPKSSFRSYKSSFNKNKSIKSVNSLNFHKLSSEPLSAIKSSPKYSTYFAEK